jgi:hypothetical protein
MPLVRTGSMWIPRHCIVYRPSRCMLAFPLQVSPPAISRLLVPLQTPQIDPTRETSTLPRVIVPPSGPSPGLCTETPSPGIAPRMFGPR